MLWNLSQIKDFQVQLVPSCNGSAKAHREQESDPVEKKWGGECSEKDEIIAQQSGICQIASAIAISIIYRERK